MKGEGVWAQLLQQRFAKTTARLGLNRERLEMDLTRFRPPSMHRDRGQQDLF